MCGDAETRTRQALAPAAAQEDGATRNGPSCRRCSPRIGPFKDYVLREQLDRRWTYTTRTGVLNFLNGWIDALRWQRLPEMAGRVPLQPCRGIAVYCDHPVRFGVVESVNTTIKAILRRARGMRDEAMLVLKLKWATARPIRSARDVMRFLHPQAVHSLR
jgi:hypothetical protein